MNREPREIRLPRQLVPSVRPADTSSALDEAFASVTDADLRCDNAHQGVPACQEGTELASLAKQVHRQLEALKQKQKSLTAWLDRLSK